MVRVSWLEKADSHRGVAMRTAHDQREARPRYPGELGKRRGEGVAVERVSTWRRTLRCAAAVRAGHTRPACRRGRPHSTARSRRMSAERELLVRSAGLEPA